MLVWTIKRFGRSALDLLANIPHLDSSGARFIAITQGIDVRPGGHPASRLFLTMRSHHRRPSRVAISE